jgi:hypothetical protein
MQEMFMTSIQAFRWLEKALAEVHRAEQNPDSDDLLITELQSRKMSQERVRMVAEKANTNASFGRRLRMRLEMEVLLESIAVWYPTGEWPRLPEIPSEECLSVCCPSRESHPDHDRA